MALHQPGRECCEARACFQGGLLFQLKALQVPSDAWFVSGFNRLLCLDLCSDLKFWFHLHCRLCRWCFDVLGFVTACVLLGVFPPTLLRVARCECEVVSRDSVRRALGRVSRRARGRHGLRGVGFEDLREFKGGFYHERFPINSFALTRARPV